jgi:hypothetical protein
MNKRKGTVLGARITGNEEANEEAKRAIEEPISNDEKYPPEDLSGWIKMEMTGSRHSAKEGGKRGRM